MLPITGIKRHPDFDIIRGNNTSQYVENDVAVIFVNDERLKNFTISSKINEPKFLVLNYRRIFHALIHKILILNP